jgi:hypothetical protein
MEAEGLKKTADACRLSQSKVKFQHCNPVVSENSVPIEVASLPEREQDDFRRPCKRAWARLIRKVWCADSLVCPRCGGQWRIISFIDNPLVIEKVLRHLKLWHPPERPPPPRCSRTLEPDTDFLAWEAAGRLFDGID